MTRLSINVNDDCKYAMQEISAHYRISHTELIRRAIAIYKFIFDELRAGNSICVRDRSGGYRTISFGGEK